MQKGLPIVFYETKYCQGRASKALWATMCRAGIQREVFETLTMKQVSDLQELGKYDRKRLAEVLSSKLDKTEHTHHNS